MTLPFSLLWFVCLKQITVTLIAFIRYHSYFDRVKTWICHQPDNWQTLGVLLVIIVQLFYNKFLYNQDGTREEGKYKNNILITSNKKKHLFLIRSAKFRERIDSAVNAAQRASKIALQKADIAISRWE